MTEGSLDPLIRLHDAGAGFAIVGEVAAVDGGRANHHNRPMISRMTAARRRSPAGRFARQRVLTC